MSLWKSHTNSETERPTFIYNKEHANWKPKSAFSVCI